LQQLPLLVLVLLQVAAASVELLLSPAALLPPLQCVAPAVAASLAPLLNCRFCSTHLL
jgi:hypothetical protein